MRTVLICHAEHIRDRRGHVIGSHSWSHPERMGWKLKKVAKAVGGRAYLAVRRRLLGWAYGDARTAGGRA